MDKKYNEWLNEVKRSIEHCPYHYDNGAWFFPGDVAPHSGQFKYRCKKLYEAGLLDREGDGTNRWGYRYRVKTT